MATKKTTKKATAKKTSTRKIKEEIAGNIIENPIQEEIEIKPEVVEEIKNDVVEQDPPMEIENGDPAVLTPVEEKKKVEPTIEEAAMKATFKETNNSKSSRLLDKSFGYSWNGMEIDL